MRFAGTVGACCHRRRKDPTCCWHQQKEEAGGSPARRGVPVFSTEGGCSQSLCSSRDPRQQAAFCSLPLAPAWLPGEESRKVSRNGGGPSKLPRGPDPARCPSTHRDEPLGRGESAKRRSCSAKRRRGGAAAPRPVAGSRRHPPPRRSAPRTPRGKDGQSPSHGGSAGKRDTPPLSTHGVLRVPADPDETYRAGARREVREGRRASGRGADEPAQPGRTAFPFLFMGSFCCCLFASLLLHTTPTSPRSRAVSRQAAAGSPCSLPAPLVASQLVLCRGREGRGGNALMLLLGRAPAALTSRWSRPAGGKAAAASPRPQR